MKWLTVLVVSTGINCYLYAATRGNVGIGNAKVVDVRYATHTAVGPVEAALCELAPAFTLVLHTWEQDLQLHPHLYIHASTP